MPSLNPYVWLAVVLLLAGGSAALWFGGDSHGRGVINAQWNVERLATAKAVAQELARQKRQADDYAKQLATAQDALNAMAAQLVAAAHAPVPDVLCHSTKGSSSGLPKVPGDTATKTAGPGSADNVWGPSFDPAPVLRNLHTAFATDYAACLDALNRVPK